MSRTFILTTLFATILSASAFAESLCYQSADSFYTAQVQLNDKGVAQSAEFAIGEKQLNLQGCFNVPKPAEGKSLRCTFLDAQIRYDLFIRQYKHAMTNEPVTQVRAIVDSGSQPDIITFSACSL